MASYSSISEKDSKYVMQTYTRQPIALEKGEGAVVWDVEGKEYIDCVAGIAVNNVGHSHPVVVKAIQDQAAKLIHVSNLYYTEMQANLAEKLVTLTGMDRVFFCNSGAEAVEAAMKLARMVTGKHEFVALKGAFHGRTMNPLSVTYKEAYKKPFEPMPVKVTFADFSDADDVANSIGPDTAAVIIEPIQGEGGINVPSEGFLEEVRKICDDTDTLLIFDEVQTGFGRTGKWFCKEHSGVQPDIMTMAKAMGGGLPMGGIAAREGLTFTKSQHASTFGGGPLVCAAALASIKVMEDENLIDRSREMGEYFRKQLIELGRDDFVEVRGKGLMIGVETNRPCADFVNAAREMGVLLNCTSDTVLRIAPPLIISKEQIDTVVDILGKV
ncbi:acetylornithine transaminase [Methanohalophilus sp.]|uniref:acetylornithine transaminase n=1 Tax=Methanohalophilus sp. TaxID=1966352 RepID=UPI0026229C4A|nr:acetylornithine transaminase [Methanohalophilus sp.]MDK2892882.1 acetylornithine/N-succinyldiaminopimelate aminotransferase [Methanohalophilus sp.]